MARPISGGHGAANWDAYLESVFDDIYGGPAGTSLPSAATQDAIQAAVAGLVSGAPGALDTLNELATALGDDANFAATVTTALAAKAPLASPALTGAPTAPTAAPATDTTQLATTAYADAAVAAQHSADSATYVARDSARDFAGDADTPINMFAAFSSQVAVHGNANAIVGMAINDLASNTPDFPTGITGYGRVSAGSAGNQTFGIFGRADLWDAGVATNEFNSFNFAAAPAGTFPPNRAFGTADHLPVAITAAAGGGFASAIGMHLCREGSAPQPFLAGIYASPDACSTYGIFIDGTAATGPGTGILIKTKTAGIGMEIDSPAGQAADPLRVLLNGTPAVRVTPSGGMKCTSSGAGGGDDVFAILSADHGSSKSFRVANATGVLQILNTAFSASLFALDDTGNLTLAAGLAFTPTTQTTAPAAGGAAALPATPAGYATVTIAGTARKVAYY